MPCAPMAQPHVAGYNTNNLFPSSGLSLTLASGQEKNKEGGNHQNQDYDSSDNMDDSDDDIEISHPRKKRYHRHTPQQIQEMEALFKEFPHPDEKQRKQLSKRLGLAPRQVKFWFQNRRTQLKATQERHENSLLRHEIEQLRAENMSLRESLRNPVCSSCGGPTANGGETMATDEQQLRIENVRLKDELARVCAFVGKVYGRSNLTSIPNSSLDLGAVSNELGGLHSASLPSINELIRDRSMVLLSIERSKVAELALAAMDELMKISQMAEPMWVRSPEGGMETLDHEEYSREFPRIIGPKPIGHKTEATRETAIVVMKSSTIVDTLVNVNRWMEMFPCMISRATIVDVISSGVGGTRNGALQLMHAELQVLSPLVPTREIYFVRFCKQHADGLWGVVDVSVDSLLENPDPCLIKCRKRPSGCLLRDMPNGRSKVTWVEHAEYDNIGVHRIFRSMVNSGMAFGAQRWLATLQRQCERITFITASNVPLPTRDVTAVPTPSGRRSMVKLAERMTNKFCGGLSASTRHSWTKLSHGNTKGIADDDIHVMTRTNVDNPAEPTGVILSAATSVWLPLSSTRLFEFLRDERLRSEWDILSSGVPIKEITNIVKGMDRRNSVSLLSAANDNQSNTVFLQESWRDNYGSMVVYAPVDIPAIHQVMNGNEAINVPLLPSGFAILSDGPECRPPAGGSLLTVAFQILVNNLPTAKLTMESVETVNDLISCTIKKIKSALRCDDE
uniref:TSA: Wollemia nobilis Ref_Wollemi_Transcript_4242_2947 transcribed RNA sequence n=1 Tax=Wollemia nobilis TaxID=56998 RepID=A0A0C9RPZ3_9CONI